MQLGEVCKSNYKEKKENLVLPLKNVVRIATNEDILENDQDLMLKTDF